MTHSSPSTWITGVTLSVAVLVNLALVKDIDAGSISELNRSDVFSDGTSECNNVMIVGMGPYDSMLPIHL
jgi:hypothetical protein|eukprot:m.219562 g.219562  ORF g.219562 m.219562 type:complete len:70 (-) comp25759_c0_seq2:1021-1230(-)